MSERASFAYLFESFRLTVDSNVIKLIRDGHEVNLDSDQSKVLQLLVENYGEPVKRRVLLTQIRGEIAAEYGPVYTAISDLRRILADSKEEGRLIKSETGGYRFTKNVRRVRLEDQTEAAVEPATALVDEDIIKDPPIDDASVQKRPSEINDQAAETESDETGPTENSFEEWIVGSGKTISFLLTACVITAVAISIALAVWSNFDTAKIAASVAQCLVIVVAIIHTVYCVGAKGFRPIDPQDPSAEVRIRQAGFKDPADFINDRDNLENALRQYTKYWRWLLLSWVPLYVFFAVEYFIGPQADVIQVLLNILNTAMIVLCFNVLNKDLEDHGSQHLTGPALLALGFILLVAVLIVTASIDSQEARKRLQEGGTVLTGIAAGITMALYVGRLQSKFLGPRPWLLILLYSYTAIQPLVLYIKGHPERALVLLDFALILKCLLYLYVTWLLQSGLLLFYFAKMKRTYGSVVEQRKAFRSLLN